MTVEPGERPLSPVHVHVEDHTPVHVHVKKPKKPSLHKDTTSNPESKPWRSSLKHNTSSTSRARSKSPGPSSHWVPPPGRSSKGSKFSWQGPSHRLEMTGPGEGVDGTPSALHLSDLDTDEEDHVSNKMRKYEKKIDSLMSEVGNLKGEVELQRSMRERDMKEEELEDVKLELDVTATENEMLRRSVDRLRETANMSMSEKDRLSLERDQLMKKLVEVEMDGQAAVKQTASLRDSIRRLKEDKRLSTSDSTHLNKQKDLLMTRLLDFESTNRALRQLLRERHEQESSSLRLLEQRDVLLKKLTETEESNQRLRSEVINKEREMCEYKMGMTAQREENVAMSGLHSSLETTKAHLQKQLRQKEGDCNRMAVQIRSMESGLAQERIDTEHLRELLAAARDKADRDKEALKKATRVQKQRAAKNEDEVERLRAQLMERDGIMAEVRSEMDSLRSRSDKLAKEKSQASAETTGLQMRVSELESIMERVEDDSKARVETATKRLQEKSTEASSLKMENERIKTTIASLEERLSQADGEIGQIRSNLRQYESLVEEYRSQINRSRREADESIVQLEEQKRETYKVRQDGETELEKVKSRLQTRLQELEPIPELLKTTELRLQDAGEKLLSYEKRHMDNTKLISELTTKVEHQANDLDQIHSKYHTSQDTTRSLESRVEGLEKKLRDLEDQNRGLLTTVAKREEAVHQANLRLDEKSRENAGLSRQLEASLSDSRRHTDSLRDKSAAKEKAIQTRILDLESQLSQCRADTARLKREKEEMERKFNSRLYDLKDRLEQSHSTNRSMQNYVQFLKNSYANVFGDSSMAATSSPIRGSQPYL